MRLVEPVQQCFFVAAVRVIPLLALLGIATTDSAGNPWANIPFLSGITANLFVVLVIFLGLLALRQIIIYLQRIQVMRTRLDFSKRLRLDLFEALAGARWEHFSAGTLHRQTQILTLDSHRAGDTVQHCFGLCAAAFVTAVQIVLASWLSPAFTLIVLTSTAVVAVFLSKRMHYVSRLGRQLTERNDAIYKLTMNFVPMLRTAKMSGTTPALLARFRADNEAIDETVTRFVAHHTASTVSIQLAVGVILSICLVLWIEVFSLGAMQISILVLIFARLAPILGQTNRLVQSLIHDLPAVENTLANIVTWRARADDAVDVSAFPVAPPTRSIGLEAVSGGYAVTHPDYVVHDVTFAMPVDKMTLLSGPTGAGKSTVADFRNRVE